MVFSVKIIDGKRYADILSFMNLPVIEDREHRFIGDDRLMYGVIAAIIDLQQPLVEIRKPYDVLRQEAYFSDLHWSISAIRSSGLQCSACMMARISSTARSTVSLMTK